MEGGFLFMADCILLSKSLANLFKATLTVYSPYSTIIYDNEHWSKFLAMA